MPFEVKKATGALGQQTTLGRGHPGPAPLPVELVAEILLLQGRLLVTSFWLMPPFATTNLSPVVLVPTLWPALVFGVFVIRRKPGPVVHKFAFRPKTAVAFD